LSERKNSYNSFDVVEANVIHTSFLFQIKKEEEEERTKKEEGKEKE